MWTYEVIQLVISHLRDEVIEIERINVDMIGPPKIVQTRKLTAQSWPQKWHVSLYRKYGRTIWGKRSIEYHRCRKNLMTVPRKILPYKLKPDTLVTKLYLQNLFKLATD